MDQNCSQSPSAADVLEGSPAKPPQVEINDSGKLSPSDRSESPDNNCAICLGRLQNKSFTDSCLHQFCFTCLLEWSKVKAECPLCKQSFKSIIHNVRSIEDYDQYHLRPSEQRLPLQTISYSVSAGDDTTTRFRYRTTMVSNQVIYSSYLQRLEHMMSQGDIIPPGFLTHHHHTHHRRQWRSSSHNHAISASLSSSRRPRLISPDYQDHSVPGTSGFRRNIYNSDLWVRRSPDLSGRFRECSAEFFLNNPAQVHRLVPWLNRELNVLLHGTEHHVPHVVGIVLDLLPRYNIRSLQFRSALIQYFGDRIDHFIHEFYAFGTSPYDMVGYDRVCIYGNRIQFSDNDLSDSSSSSDSDIQVVDVVRSDSAAIADTANVPSHDVSHPATDSPIAGPSRNQDDQNALIAVSSEDDSDGSDCLIVGSVKPRHLRTPEIITLGDSDADVGAGNNEVENSLQISEESEGEVDRKPLICRSASNSGSNVSFCKVIYNRNRTLNLVTSSEESSGEEWGLARRRSSSSKHKKDKRERSDPKKKIKDKDNTRKKKVSREKKSKPVKHWKKKLCRKIESSSSSSDNEPVVMVNRKRRVLPSTSDSQSENEFKVNRDFINPYSNKLKPRGLTTRLKSVVHVRRNAIENDAPLRTSDRGPSICSGTSSHCSTNYSTPSTSSHCSANYTASMVPNGGYSPRLILKRNRLLSGSDSSVSSSKSSHSSYSPSHKRKHRKTKSRRKRS